MTNLTADRIKAAKSWVYDKDTHSTFPVWQTILAALELAEQKPVAVPDKETQDPDVDKVISDIAKETETSEKSVVKRAIATYQLIHLGKANLVNSDEMPVLSQRQPDGYIKLPESIDEATKMHMVAHRYLSDNGYFAAPTAKGNV